MKTSKSCHLWIEKLVVAESLSSAECAAFEAHIASCPNCASLLHEYQHLVTRIQTLRSIKPLAQTTSTFLWRDVQVKRVQSKNVSHYLRTSLLRFLTPIVRKNKMQIALPAILCILVISLIIFHDLYTQSVSDGFNVYNTTLATAKNISSSCISLSINQQNTCTARFIGSIHNTRSHLTSTMFLFIQQDQRITRGFCAIHSPLIRNGSLQGSITADSRIEFTIHDSQSILTFHFLGTIYSDGSISGTYTTSDNQAGTWAARPL